MNVSIVTVTYNSVDVLPEYATCMAELQSVESIIVDNGSSDQSVRLAEGFSQKVLSLDRNLGFGCASNLGAAEASAADAYLFLNPDCQLTDETLRALSGILESHANVGAVAPAMRYPSGDIGISAGGKVSLLKEWLAFLGLDSLVPTRVKRWVRAFYRRWGWPAIAEYAMAEVGPTREPSEQGWLSGFCLLVRRTAFEQVGGFDDRFFLYFEDVDLSVRLRKAGWRLLSVESATALHLESTSTGEVGKSSHYYAGLRTYFEIHGTSIERLLGRALARLATK